MKIQNNKISYTPQFGMLHVANCGKIKLYRVTNNQDVRYLRNLPEHVNIEELMPDLSKSACARWHEMLEYAVDMMQNPDNITYLDVFNNKICGIITNFPNKTTIIDCICTWPIIAGQKVKLAGKSLFYKVFRDFDQNQGTRIKLDAITDGPYDTVQKYESLGFRTTSRVYPTKIEMEANRHKIKQILPQLKTLVKYEEIVPKSVNINELSL